MVLQICSSWILINVIRDVPCQISHFWVYPVSPFPRNGQNMALLWPKHGPHMVLLIGSSWILINVPRDISYQKSNFWVYPVAPIPRNGNLAHLLRFRKNQLGGPCFGNRRAIFWQFLRNGATGYTQKCEMWHVTSMDTLIKIQEVPNWRTLWGPGFGHKRAIFWLYLVKGATGYTKQ